MVINVHLIDILMDQIWNDDQGDFEINEKIIGTYELVDCTYKGDMNDKYIFEITIQYLAEDKKEKYKYILNNLEGENELIKL